MSDQKISQLPASTTPLAGTEVLPVVQGGATKQVSISNLTAGRSVNATSFVPSGSTIPANGVFLPATNAVGFATNSNERVRISATGGVSVGGTSDPGANNLTVSGAATNFIGAINPTAASGGGFSPSPRLSMSGSQWNSSSGPVAMVGYLQLNSILTNVASPTAKVSIFAGANNVTPTEVAFFGTDGSYSNKQASAASAAASQILGNANAQGTATWRTVVRQVPVVSLGTQLIIPFVSQAGLNQTTIIRLTGTSAKSNNKDTNRGFSAYISVGHLTSISVSSWDLGGNIASVTASGMNVIVDFTNAYTSSLADGVFIALEYLCANTVASIDVASISMN